jgi:hypothetical protein
MPFSKERALDMRFHKHANGDLVSNEGFLVRQEGRFALKHLEGNRGVTVPIESGYDPRFYLTVYANSVERFDPPNDAERVHEDVRRRIIQNVSDSLLFEGVRHELVWGEFEIESMR